MYSWVTTTGVAGTVFWDIGHMLTFRRYFLSQLVFATHFNIFVALDDGTKSFYECVCEHEATF